MLLHETFLSRTYKNKRKYLYHGTHDQKEREKNRKVVVRHGITDITIISKATYVVHSIKKSKEML
jgi:hypothetical protein